MELINEKMRNSTVLVTGATGFIGAQLVKRLLEMAKGSQFEVQVITQIRDEKKADRVFDDLNVDLQHVVSDIVELDVNKMRNAFPELDKIDYIFHCASITSSKEMVQKPVEVFESIVLGTRNILEIAREYNVTSMVYLSTMEVYGAFEGIREERIIEEELGHVNLLETRSCYPIGKRMAENLCFSYYSEYKIPVRIARLAQTFGKGVAKEDQRVFSQFANCAYEGKDIVLHTDGTSQGNYCGITDSINALLRIVHDGIAGEAYNVVNESLTMTIYQMAQFVAEKIAKGKIQIRFDIPEENQFGYARKTSMRLSGKKLELLGWEPTEGMEKMYVDMIVDWDRICSKEMSGIFRNI